jgi:hypothetical protein
MRNFAVSSGVRAEDYWSRIAAGPHLGFRKLAEGEGAWIARWRDSEGARHYHAIGAQPPSDAAWRRVASFSNVARRRERFLTMAERKRLYAAASPDLKRLIRAVALTAARPGEIAMTCTGAFDARARTPLYAVRYDWTAYGAFGAHRSRNRTEHAVQDRAIVRVSTNPMEAIYDVHNQESRASGVAGQGPRAFKAVFRKDSAPPRGWAE